MNHHDVRVELECKLKQAECIYCGDTSERNKRRVDIRRTLLEGYQRNMRYMTQFLETVNK